MDIGDYRKFMRIRSCLEELVTMLDYAKVHLVRGLSSEDKEFWHKRLERLEEEFNEN